MGHAPQPVPLDNTTPITVLVVDDAASNRGLAREALTRAGMEVVLAENGQEALRLAPGVDAVLLDVVMPGLDGLAVCRLLRARPETADLPVLFCTTTADEASQIEGFKVGGDDYVLKPFSGPVLVGRIRRLAAAYRDRRRVGRLLEDLRHAYDELEAGQAQLLESERHAMMGVLATGLAHEINNPLASISGNIEWIKSLLQEQPPESTWVAEAIEVLGEAAGAVERIAAIVDQMRTFDPRLRHRGYCDMRAATRSTLELLRSTLPQGIALVLQLEDELRVSMDESDFCNVLVQLVRNAVTAMDQPRQGGHRLTLKVARGDAGAMLEVGDTGHGIAMADLSRVFDPFFTHKTSWRATGLGLTLCRNLVTKAGGRIDISSQPDQGTQVKIWLPLLDGAPLPEAQP